MLNIKWYKERPRVLSGFTNYYYIGPITVEKYSGSVYTYQQLLDTELNTEHFHQVFLLLILIDISVHGTCSNDSVKL